jgi:hypothetical protein
MKKFVVLLLAISIAGCAANNAILPSLEGKQRVKINQQEPRPQAPNQNTNDPKGE